MEGDITQAITKVSYGRISGTVDAKTVNAARHVLLGRLHPPLREGFKAKLALGEFI